MQEHGRTRLRVVLIALCAAAVALGVTACGGGSSSSGGSTAAASSTSGSSSDTSGKPTWVHGILTPKGDSGYQLMAAEKKFYDQMGVNVEIKQFVGNVQLTQALVSGAIDSGDTSPGPIFDADLGGANVKLIGSTLPKITYAVIARNDIKSFADLQGKTIGASAPGAFPDSVVRAMMSTKGVDPSSVKVVPVGDDAQRMQALTAGRIDAAAVSVAFVPLAQKDPNLHLLAMAGDVIPKYPRFMIAANGDSLQSKPDAAVRFLAGEMKGVCYAVQHPDAERQVAASHLNVSPDDPVIAYTQKVISQAKAASPTSGIPQGMLTYLQQVRKQQGATDKLVNLGDVVDRSFRTKALKMANLPAACLNDPNADQVPTG